jgi:hypothetical protein
MKRPPTGTDKGSENLVPPGTYEPSSHLRRQIGNAHAPTVVPEGRGFPPALTEMSSSRSECTPSPQAHDVLMEPSATRTRLNCAVSLTRPTKSP